MPFSFNNSLNKLVSVFRDRTLAKAFATMFNNVGNGIHSVSFTVGAEATNAIVVSLQCKDAYGVNVTGPQVIDVILFTSAAMTALNANDYTIAAGSNGKIIEVSADKTIRCLTNSTGAVDISLTITGAATCFVGAILPGGKLTVSGTVTHAA